MVIGDAVVLGNYKYFIITILDNYLVLLVNKLRDAFMLGCNVTEACYYADISRQTLYKRLKDDPLLNDKIERWRSCINFKAKKLVSSAIDQGDVKTALDVLKHTSSDYQERKSVELTGSKGGALIFKWATDGDDVNNE